MKPGIYLFFNEEKKKRLDVDAKINQMEEKKIYVIEEEEEVEIKNNFLNETV